MITCAESGMSSASAVKGWTEQALSFECQGHALIGVLCLPANNAARTGVVVVVGGPQYRAGSHRQFVLLARHLASRGHATLRYDVRGMGDSEGDSRGFATLDDDISAAIDALLASQAHLTGVVLWGLCDGASAALLYWRRRRDARVTAMCLLNPWLRSELGQARTQVRHYYVQRLMQPAFWHKALLGGVGLRALADLAGNLRRALLGTAKSSPAGEPSPDEDFRTAMAAAWKQFPGRLMLVMSGRDYTAKEFLDGAQNEQAWAGALSRAGLHRVDLPEADHTFSAAAQRRACEQAVADWLHELAPDGGERQGLT